MFMIHLYSWIEWSLYCVLTSHMEMSDSVGGELRIWCFWRLACCTKALTVGQFKLGICIQQQTAWQKEKTKRRKREKNVKTVRLNCWTAHECVCLAWLIHPSVISIITVCTWMLSLRLAALQHVFDCCYELLSSVVRDHSQLSTFSKGHKPYFFSDPVLLPVFRKTDFTSSFWSFL